MIYSGLKRYRERPWCGHLLHNPSPHTRQWRYKALHIPSPAATEKGTQTPNDCSPEEWDLQLAKGQGCQNNAGHCCYSKQSTIKWLMTNVHGLRPCIWPLDSFLIGYTGTVQVTVFISFEKRLLQCSGKWRETSVPAALHCKCCSLSKPVYTFPWKATWGTKTNNERQGKTPVKKVLDEAAFIYVAWKTFSPAFCFMITISDNTSILEQLDEEELTTKG